MKKILVVDDEAAITTHLEVRLNYMGYKVVGRASSGEEALAKSRLFKPDLVIMDIVMPGEMDGIEAASILKNELDIPVIFLTAYGDDALIKRAKKVEPFGYIIKPFQDNEIKAALQIALYNKEIYDLMKESSRTWQELAEIMNEAVILARRSGVIYFWNQGAQQIFGYSKEEVSGRPFSILLDEHPDPRFLAEIQRLLLFTRSKIAGKWIEALGRRKDRSIIPIEICINPWESKGKFFFIILAKDISERKMSMASLEKALREKHQDVEEYKNAVSQNLHLVYKLLHLQSQCLEKKEQFINPQEQREMLIKKLSTNQELNQLPPCSTVNFYSYLRNLTTRLLEAYPIDRHRVQINIEAKKNLDFDIRRAIPLGLLVSELVSNALKYAFPGKKEGEIKIKFFQDESGNYKLQVSDSGIGLPEKADPHHPKSMGFQIVNDLVKQLKGSLEIKRGRGTAFFIDIPSFEV